MDDGGSRVKVLRSDSWSRSLAWFKSMVASERSPSSRFFGRSS